MYVFLFNGNDKVTILVKGKIYVSQNDQSAAI